MSDLGGRNPTSQPSTRSASPPVPRHFFQNRVPQGLDDTQETLENMRSDFEQADGRLELVRDEGDLAHGRLDCLRKEFQPANDRLEQLHNDFQLANDHLERLREDNKINQDRLALHELDMTAIRIAIKRLGMAIMRLNDFVGTLSHAHPLPHRAVGDDGAPANGCPHFRDDCPLRFSYHAETNAPKIELSD
ncbi:unnamed protein product [Aphanomyces euteiches]|nr:hypothetical protein Ae201684P_001841 [Aphanomyces euteiches]